MDSDLMFSLIQNAALLLAMVFVYDAFPRSHKRELDVFWRVGLGVLIGVITVSVMLSSWQYSEGVFFDSRTVILGISGMFFGGVPTLVAVIISALFRFHEGALLYGLEWVRFSHRHWWGICGESIVRAI